LLRKFINKNAQIYLVFVYRKLELLISLLSFFKINRIIDLKIKNIEKYLYIKNFEHQIVNFAKLNLDINKNSKS